MKNKIILRKPRSAQRVEISPDLSMDPDGWFLNVNYIENKTNKLKSTTCIIEKDLPQWIGSLERNGWIIETENQ